MRRNNIKSLRKLKKRMDIFPLFFYEHYEHYKQSCTNNHIYPVFSPPLKKRLINLTPYDIINQYLSWAETHKGYEFWRETANNI